MAIAGAVALAASSPPALGATAHGADAVADVPTASAELFDASGARQGQVSFRQDGQGVLVRVRASGLSAGFHGFHVHAVGDCTAGSPGATFTAAGGHLASAGQTHGVSTFGDAGGHDGDMPVLFANGSGVVDATFRTDNFTIPEIVDAAGNGSAVIIHASPDNFANIPLRYTTASGSGPDATTLATGDSGARQRCGVVRSGPIGFGTGYLLTARDGGVFAFGGAAYRGSMGGQPLAAPIVGMAAAPSREGYWLVGRDGGVFSFNAPFYGSARQQHLLFPVVGLAATPGDAGATLIDSSGASRGSVSFAQVPDRIRVTVTATGLTPGWHGMHIHTKGDCTVGDPNTPFTAAGGHLNGGGQSHGVAGGDPTGHDGDLPLLFADANGTASASFLTDDFNLGQLLDGDGSAIMVHAGADNYGNIPSRYLAGGAGPDATTASTGDAGTRARCGVVRVTGGYLLADQAGTVFPFGQAPAVAGRGGGLLNAPVVGIISSPSGLGAWLVAADGGIFANGDAGFFGSTGSVHPNKPIVGMAATPTGLGYWLVAADGGVFAFGDARYLGSTGDVTLSQPVVGIVASATGGGYQLIAKDGGVFSFGDAEFAGSTGSQRLNMPIEGGARQG